MPDSKPTRRDAVIIGSGLGGLSCAAAFARKGYRPLVLEQHDKSGGYATAFRRPGGFLFDVSLHSTTVGQRNGVRNLIGGFPEITEVEFVPHTHLYRAAERNSGAGLQHEPLLLPGVSRLEKGALREN